MNEMRQISRYAYPNTRIRSMFSELLDEDFFSRLSGTDFNGFLDILEKTEYADLIKGRESITPEEFEVSCIKADREKIKKISSFFLSKNEKRIILLLDERYMVEQLKFALRLWKRKQQSFQSQYRGEFSHIFNAKTIDEVQDLLEESGYASAVGNAKEMYEKTGSLYMVEVLIDRQYFEKLQDAIGRLSSTDRIIARNIIGAEIDRENLLWLGRILLYYSGKIPSEMAGFIPGGATLSEKDLRKLMSQSMTSSVELKLPQRYLEIIEKLPENLADIDRILEGIIIHQIKKALVEKPFSIGIPLGYIFLKLRETRRLVSVFVSKYLSVKQ